MNKEIIDKRIKALEFDKPDLDLTGGVRHIIRVLKVISSEENGIIKSPTKELVEILEDHLILRKDDFELRVHKEELLSNEYETVYCGQLSLPMVCIKIPTYPRSSREEKDLKEYIEKNIIDEWYGRYKFRMKEKENGTD